MNISIGIEGGKFSIKLGGMSSGEFDDVRILLRELVEQDKRFSNAEASQLELQSVIAMMHSKTQE